VEADSAGVKNLVLSDLQTENRRTEVGDADVNAGPDWSSVRGGIVKARVYK